MIFQLYMRIYVLHIFGFSFYYILTTISYLKTDFRVMTSFQLYLIGFNVEYLLMNLMFVSDEYGQKPNQIDQKFEERCILINIRDHYDYD
jgi:hypothetical protein